jgi:hypothetical protein
VAYFLRQARRSAWTGEAEVSAERRADAIASFGRRAEDTDGVSIFSIGQDTHVQVVVAAIACGKREANKIDLLKLEDQEVARFGPVTTVIGTLPVRTANPLHRVLDWTPEQLERLVDHLLGAARQPTRSSPLCWPSTQRTSMRGHTGTGYVSFRLG